VAKPPMPPARIDEVRLKQFMGKYVNDNLIFEARK